MLEAECEAVAAYVGDLLARAASPSAPPSSEQGALFVSSLSLALQSLVALTKNRVLRGALRSTRYGYSGEGHS